jgi:7-cyano-7-deazaguanine synthase
VRRGIKVRAARQHSVPHDKISKIQGLALSGRKSFCVSGKVAALRAGGLPDDRGHQAARHCAARPGPILLEPAATPARTRSFEYSRSFTVTRKDAKNSALVLFSGGQDSATCLTWALDRYETVETLGFDYGQRHRVELECRDGFRAALAQQFPVWGERLGDDHMIDLSVLGAISDTAMTREIQIETAASGLPNTFVPGRNLMFMTIAAAIAYRRGLRVLVGGMCETDFSGYPDCRDDTLKALQVALNLGMDSRFVLETPLMWLDKADTWRLAHQLGGDELVELVRVETHTCYVGERAELHAWGFGCGECPACRLRKRGFEAYLAGGQVTEPV